jgi:hypothetical protein
MFASNREYFVRKSSSTKPVETGSKNVTINARNVTKNAFEMLVLTIGSSWAATSNTPNKLFTDT